MGARRKLGVVAEPLLPIVSSRIPALLVSKDEKPQRQPVMSIQILESARDPTLVDSSNTTTLIGRYKEFK
jgi:hypothetical protein